MERGVAEAFSAIPEGGAAASAAGEKVKVVVAVDDSDESSYALKWVLENLVGPDTDEYFLTIIHVMEPFPHYMFPGSPAVYVYPSTSIIQSVNKAQRENAAAIITRAIDLCSQREVQVKTSIVEGDPKEMICEIGEQMEADLIVIGSRGRGKIKRAFIGGVSNYVIHQSKCPVLVIKAPTSTEVYTAAGRGEARNFQWRGLY